MKKKLMLLLALATIGCSAFGFASCDLLEKLPFFGDKVVDEQPGDDEYVVTYADGDTILNTVVVADGSAPEKPADPTKTGYTFKCWSYDPHGVNVCEFNKALNKNSTLYAQWELDSYKVTYVVGETEYYWTDTAYFTIPERPADPVDEKTNQYFVGWYTETTFENKYRFYEPLEGDTTLYAKFTGANQISTVEELMAISKAPAASYILTADINLKNKEWTPIENLTGEIDGNDHTISYFQINNTSGHVGFVTTNNGTIKDLTLDNFVLNVNTSSVLTAGALVGTNNGTVSNCKILNTKNPASNNITYKTSPNTTGSSNAWLGGIVGVNTGTVADCYSEGNMRAYTNAYVSNPSSWDANSYTLNTYISALVGSNSGTVKNSNSVMALNATGWSQSEYRSHATDTSYVYMLMAGIVGANTKTVTECNYNGEMTSTASGNGGRYARFSGVAYSNGSSATITKSWADGKGSQLEGSFSNVGGAGFCYTNSGTIENCYTNFDIETESTGGDVYGGFVGVNYHAVTNCYTATNITTKGECSIGGFVGVLADNGTIGGSFCLGNITCTYDGKLDAFDGGFRDGGALSCFYSADMVISVNSAIKVTEEENIAIQVKTYDELMSAALLVEEMFWETDIWNIDGYNAPTLK